MGRPLLFALALAVVAAGGISFLVLKHRDRRPPHVKALAERRLKDVQVLGAELFLRCAARSLDPARSPFEGTGLVADEEVLEAKLVCRELVPGLGLGVTLPPLRAKQFDSESRNGRTYALDGRERDDTTLWQAYAVDPSLVVGGQAVDLCVVEENVPEQGPSTLCVAFRVAP
ncbi:MAG: hypothetical protein HY908_30090 [Myxococcales bacterium]|nr:hypothetical protein [Myxococcales bacterium]